VPAWAASDLRVDTGMCGCARVGDRARVRARARARASVRVRARMWLG